MPEYALVPATAQHHLYQIINKIHSKEITSVAQIHDTIAENPDINANESLRRSIDEALLQQALVGLRSMVVPPTNITCLPAAVLARIFNTKTSGDAGSQTQKRNTLRLVCKRWEQIATQLPSTQNERNAWSMRKFLNVPHIFQARTALSRMITSQSLLFSMHELGAESNLIALLSALHEKALDETTISFIKAICAAPQIYAVKVLNGNIQNLRFRCTNNDDPLLVVSLLGSSQGTSITLCGEGTFEQSVSKLHKLNSMLERTNYGWSRLQVNGLSFSDSVPGDIAPFINKMKPTNIWLDGTRGHVLTGDIEGLNSTAFAYVGDHFRCTLTISFRGAEGVNQIFEQLKQIVSQCGDSIPFTELTLRACGGTYTVYDSHSLLADCRDRMLALRWPRDRIAHLDFDVSGLRECIDVLGKDVYVEPTAWIQHQSVIATL